MLKRGLWVLASLILGAGVLAQTTDCPEFMYDYIEQTADLCATTGRNEICYGSNAIEVQLTDSATSFAQPGDITALANVDSIRTSGLDEASQEFGMALLQVQADVEGALPGQVVTFLLMGNVSVDGINEGEAPMQAFRFNTGIGAPTCESSNYDALMIDSPDGLTINFTVNGVDIELGSTAIIVGKPDNKIDMLVLEGHGRVTAMGQTVEVEEGFWTQIPMDVETGNEAVGAPEEPVPFGLPRVTHLPLNVLYAGQNIALNKPVTADSALETNPAANLVNGIQEDSWQAEGGTHTLDIDLLQEYSIDAIRIKGAEEAEGLFTAAYNLYVGDAAGNYTLVQSFDNGDGGDEWLIFEAPIPLLFVRYVRISTNSEDAIGLAEVEVYASGFYGCVVSAAAANTEATNLRAEANTSAEILGTFEATDRAIAVGQALDAEGQTWWELEGGAWIRGDRVVGRGSCTFLPEA
jgi:hypothetical protein